MSNRKRNRRPKPTGPLKRHYNVEMINDFLDHLMWELRIAAFENQQKDPKVTNPELVEQLAKYIAKWNTNALMAATIISKEFTEDELKEVGPAIREARIECINTAIKALEELVPVLSEAFECAKHPDKLPARKIGPEGITYGFLDKQSWLRNEDESEQ